MIGFTQLGTNGFCSGSTLQQGVAIANCESVCAADSACLSYVIVDTSCFTSTE